MNVLVTGAAGFIGSFVCHRLLNKGYNVIGVDNLNDYYDVQLKQDRLDRLTSINFTFSKTDVVDTDALSDIFSENQVELVIHLAAEAGVTYGQQQPELFINSNIVGFNHILENCRKHRIKHLVYASTAAVYGDNVDFPVTESSNSDQPLTLYAATKKANEVLAHSYSHQFDIKITGLRFFTVYGPWARPDMALFKFTKQILEQKPIKLHNHGNHTRDLIYIDDLVDAIDAVVHQSNDSNQQPLHQIYNVGNEQAIDLIDMVSTLENQPGIKTEHIGMPLQKGEIKDNKADATAFYQQFGIKPQVPFDEGVEKFIQWYREYHQR